MTVVISNSRNDLPPCPFCGGIPEMYYPFHLLGQRLHAATYHGGVRCTKCRCRTDTSTPPDAAIAAWTARASHGADFAELSAQRDALIAQLARANEIIVKIGVIAMEAAKS